MRRNFKKVFKGSGPAGSVVLFMVLCVIFPTIIVQGRFTGITAWEVLLTILLCLSLRLTSEE